MAIGKSREKTDAGDDRSDGAGGLPGLCNGFLDVGRNFL